jgi:hypothetical protein
VVFITKKKEKRRTTVGYTYCSKQNEIKILKEWELLSVDTGPVSYQDHVNANMGNQYYGTQFACRW